MKTRGIVLALGGVMILAAAALIGPAHAQATAASAKYQYKCVTGLPQQMFKPETIAALNQEGAAGWRLLDGLSIQNHLSGGDQFCFVREVR